MCYRYTNPLSHGRDLLYANYGKSQAFFPFPADFYQSSESSISKGKFFIPGRLLRWERTVVRAGPYNSKPRLRFFPREGFSLQNVLLDIGKRSFFALIPQHFQYIIQFLLRVGVHTGTLHTVAEIGKRRAVSIAFPLIGHTGSPSVHNHLYQIPPGHMQGFILAGFLVDIRPIFVMVTVSAFVVHPRLTIALFLTLCGVGATCSLIESCAGEEFCGRVFGQIVGEPLPIQSHLEAACHYQKAVLGDGLKMLPNFHTIYNSLSTLSVSGLFRTAASSPKGRAKNGPSRTPVPTKRKENYLAKKPTFL